MLALYLRRDDFIIFLGPIGYIAHHRGVVTQSSPVNTYELRFGLLLGQRDLWLDGLATVSGSAPLLSCGHFQRVLVAEIPGRPSTQLFGQ